MLSGCCIEDSAWDCPSTALESELPYWTLQNQWGADWGEAGSIRIQPSIGAGVLGMNQHVEWVTV